MRSSPVLLTVLTVLAMLYVFAILTAFTSLTGLVIVLFCAIGAYAIGVWLRG